MESFDAVSFENFSQFGYWNKNTSGEKTWIFVSMRGLGKPAPLDNDEYRRVAEVRRDVWRAGATGLSQAV